MIPAPRHLVLDLLLAADGQALSAREAIAACRLFGHRQSSVRVALARLSSEGLIEGTERGWYQLSARAHELERGDLADAGVRARDERDLALDTEKLGRVDLPVSLISQMRRSVTVDQRNAPAPRLPVTLGQTFFVTESSGLKYSRVRHAMPSRNHQKPT